MISPYQPGILFNGDRTMTLFPLQDDVHQGHG
jgi:hypothetical protein